MIDRDRDGVINSRDFFPDDASEWLDSDGDGLGNNSDADDDGDGVEDLADAFPLDGTEWLDTDADGIGNQVDVDDDGDGVIDAQDWAPLDPLNPEILMATALEISETATTITISCQTGSIQRHWTQACRLYKIQFQRYEFFGSFHWLE